MLFMVHRYKHLPVRMNFANEFKSILYSTFHFNFIDILGHSNNKKLPIEASYSPDSQFIFAGSVDGRVHVWNADTGYKICALNGDHPAPVQCVQFNPKYMMLASACTNMAFWLPNPEDPPQ